jgi:hypothetical protein|nr:MAG TPA: hypothetical protein [Caudoviricetes sp.]
MQIQYNGKSKILRRIVALVNRSQNVALRQDNTDKNTLYWTGLDGVEITVNIPSGAVEVDTELSETSTNPVENQAITKELAQKADKSVIPTVGDGVLSVQRNGKSVGTFSANAAKDTAVNISVPEKVSELENDAGYGTYTKPTTGIPKSDLASGVQASLGKADTALQKHQDISGKLDKTGDASSTTASFAAASSRENVKTGEKLSVLFGKIAKWFTDLKAVAFSGSYKDLSDKPTIPDISGKQDKLTAGTNITIIGSTISAKDTTYGNASASVAGLMSAADKSKLDGINLVRYLRYNAAGGMIKGTWYKFASFNCTRYYNYSTAIFVAGFRYDVMGLFRITAGNAQGKPVASRVYISNITGDLRGIVGYIINGNTVNFFLKPGTGMYGYVARIGATAETGDFITQTDLVAATTEEAASIVPFTAAGTDVAFSNHSNETDKISNGTLRSGFYVNAAVNSTSGYTWFRMATCKISGAYETVNTTFLITNGMTGQGLLSCGIRNGGTGKTVESCTLVFSARNGSSVPPGMFRIVAINSDTGVTYELWGQITARWYGVRYTVLDERNISGGKYNNWKLESHSDADAKTAPTTGNYYVNSTDTSIATTLTDSGWVAMTLGSYAASGTVQYRTYGNQITITGKVVLKSEIRTNYHAPQSIANTKLDFSKIKGCSGFGRSSTGTGVYVQATRFGDDNIIDVFSIDSNIAAGATLYFTITGFID